MEKNNIFEKFILTDKDFKNFTMSIIIGILVGSIIGIVVKDIIFFSPLGGLIGIIVMYIGSIYKKIFKNK